MEVDSDGGFDSSFFFEESITRLFHDLDVDTSGIVRGEGHQRGLRSIEEGGSAAQRISIDYHRLTYFPCFQ